ncbi:histone-lysine N-methyltransferase SETMAR [Trichonephila clavata]|uniref:Histone-lysine N-methyltransferase SETMAR n=1 Tax=Trichonephila clavata TaxID=2740835 RepID=A0A8X6KC43_TRICU|nr:histone-lysine N-methyltransferase SETMAR [Trichonephila clavata]
MDVSKEKIRYILQFFLYKGKNASLVAYIVNGVYDRDTVTANYVQLWFRRFHSGMPVVENVLKITEMIEIDRHISSRSTCQELKINHKTILSHLYIAGFKKKLDVWVPHQLTQKT